MHPSRQPAGSRNPAGLPPARQGFVELGRQFAPLGKGTDREDAADDSYLVWALSARSRFDWPKLLKKSLVVVLGEPGSGKTWELEHQAARLAAAGEYAFFIRLEDLIRQTMAEALGAGAGDFAEWRAGAESATFFLDSVDESKLNGAEDFYSALRNFRDSLPANFGARTRIFLSSRISEWHPETDGARVREYFGVKGRVEKAEPDDDEETSTTKPTDDGLFVVQITPLDREQVGNFSRAKGYGRVEEFLIELDRAHAWEFARRPIDVLALADFWQQERRIGSLTDLIDFDLQRKLRERRDRVGDPLSDAESRLGVEALAAGAVFCGEANIKVSDENLTGAGLDGRLCAPDDWTRDKFDALLTRPVFDGASFGRVRFHHRRVREYLAASWVGARMRAGCSTNELEALFFEHISGRRVLRASRGPVAAWLCAGGEPWNAAMRRWVLDAAPNLNLRFGDPHALPLDYKRAILAKLVEQARVRQRLWLETDDDALSRLADPGLVPDIEAIIRDRALSTDLRAAMIETVRHGRLAGCLPVLLDLVASAAEPDDLKVYSVAALRELNDAASLVRLAAIAAALPQVYTGLTDLLVDALFPAQLTVDELVDLLRKTYDRNGRRPDLAWQVTGHLKERLKPEQAGPLLERFVPLLRTEPLFPSERGEAGVSQEFAWLRPLVMVALTALLRQRTLTTTEAANASAAVALVSSLRRRHDITGEDRPKLNELTLAHPAVRREFFWAAIHRRRLLGLPEVTRVHEVFSSFYELLEPVYADVDWLVADLDGISDAADREVALRHAMQWYNDTGRPWHLRWKIVRAVGSHVHLNAVLNELDQVGLVRPLKRYYYLFERAYHFRRRQGRTAFDWVRRRVNGLRSRFFLSRNLSRIARGELFGVTSRLLDDADPKNRSRWTVSRWDGVTSKWGRPVTAAARSACKQFWRTFRPLLPHESADTNRVANGLIVGLTGLQCAWVDGELDFATLSDEDVRLATRYAMNEMNGFPPWLPILAEIRPEAVGAVFAECVTAEWDYPANRPRGPESLQRFAWSGGPVLPAMQTTILTRLAVGDPPSPRSLSLVLTLLSNQAAPPLAELEAIARTRLANPATGTGPAALWFSIWLQIDPGEALDAWEQDLRNRADADQMMLLVCAGLQDRDFGNGPRLAQPRHRTVLSVRRLLPVVFAHVRPADDIDRTMSGGYTPGARDYAQEFRGGLLRVLVDSPDPVASDVLEELAGSVALAPLRDRLLHLRDEHLQQQADRQRWRPSDVRQFTREHEVDPQTDRDLFRIVLKRFSDVKNDVERSDLGLRTQLRPKDLESRLRIWLAQELIRRSRQRYTVPQEAVIDQNQRPDIRLENPRTDAVSTEIKWAQRWSFNELVEALEVQLLGQYLRAHNSRHGVLVLGMIDGGQQGWDPPGGGRLSFPELIAVLQSRAAELERQHPEVKRLSVVGIDFRDPGAPVSRTP